MASSSRIRAASPRISSISSSDSANPRAISSGAAGRPLPVIVATTMRTPSSERCFRSRSATSEMSPTPSPSTKVTPASIVSTMRGAVAGTTSTTEPFSAITIQSAGTPASRASRAWAACMRISPWIGITAFGRTSESRVRSSSARPWPETWTGAFSSCSTSAPRFVSWLIASCTRSSFPGTGRAEMITVSPRSTFTVGWSS